ncbi:hypothetical protein [Kitasatospora viridis]|uniref:Uncharacterized protein n=1 Tax=Kitasatospora viridis TaxID=281105 RepID=A0A561SA91_9ACTN|nr:hypothetical protein [Kitasatospora viridis]TWF71724.1 hypothetical protein FHX73_1895 [Kitasatospora viridis]
MATDKPAKLTPTMITALLDALTAFGHEVHAPKGTANALIRRDLAFEHGTGTNRRVLLTAAGRAEAVRHAEEPPTGDDDAQASKARRDHVRTIADAMACNPATGTYPNRYNTSVTANGIPEPGRIITPPLVRARIVAAVWRGAAVTRQKSDDGRDVIVIRELSGTVTKMTDTTPAPDAPNSGPIADRVGHRSHSPIGPALDLLDAAGLTGCTVESGGPGVVRVTGPKLSAIVDAFTNDPYREWRASIETNLVTRNEYVRAAVSGPAGLAVYPTTPTPAHFDYPRDARVAVADGTVRRVARMVYRDGEPTRVKVTDDGGAEWLATECSPVVSDFPSGTLVNVVSLQGGGSFPAILRDTTTLHGRRAWLVQNADTDQPAIMSSRDNILTMR